MTQPHRKGHRSKNKTIQRRIERKQRRAAILFLADKKVVGKKRKKKSGDKPTKPSKPYPCSPKQMSLGEPIPKPP